LTSEGGKVAKWDADARRQAATRLDELVNRLDGPLTGEDGTFGWSDDLRVGLLEWSTELRGKLRRGEELTASDLASGMVRWLDAAGVGEGELVELAAGASNAVRRVIDGPPPDASWLQRRRTKREVREGVAGIDKLVAQSDAQRTEENPHDGR
jgi:hypothetical protein